MSSTALTTSGSAPAIPLITAGAVDFFIGYQVCRVVQHLAALELEIRRRQIVPVHVERHLLVHVHME